MTTLTGNLPIMVTVTWESRLHTPKYFLLRNLFALDLCFSSITAPKVLVDLLSERKTISFNGCVTQMFFFHLLGGADVFSLSVMALDHYVAISRPLHYLTIMSKERCTSLVVASWVGGFVHSIMQISLLLPLPFYGPNVLDTFYCDVPQVLKLACTDTFTLELLMISNNGLLSWFTFFLPHLLHSHPHDAEVSGRGGQEESHLPLPFPHHGGEPALCAMHLCLRQPLHCPPDRYRHFCHLHCHLPYVISPINPMIYTLRNQEMKSAMRKLKKQLGHLERL